MNSFGAERILRRHGHRFAQRCGTEEVSQGHLVVSNDDKAPCSALDLTTPRKTMRQRAEEMKYD